MFRPSKLTPADRRGTILITTLALLTLFASVALVMVIYAQGAAERARITRDAMSAAANDFPDDGIGTVNKFLSQFIFDAPDTGGGLNSSLRGHSLMATMYGRQGYNTIPWNGFGTFSQGITVEGASLDQRRFVNRRVFVPGQAVWDPEYTGSRSNLIQGNTNAYIPKNAPYTYPDVNNLFLASLIPATGEVPVISYHREHLFGTLAPTNPNWLAANPQGKYLSLRPRPEDHAKDANGRPLFPYPPQNADGSYTGDVQNLPGGVGPQRNDSIWIDIGMPIITLGNGKRYQPLVAPLILDLDGRLNLNVVGNEMAGVGAGHRSGAGIGGWEVNLAKALGAEGNTIVSTRNQTLQNRALQTTKSFAKLPAGTTRIPHYASVPWRGYTAATPIVLPGIAPGTAFATEPTYTTGAGCSCDNTPVVHPALYNPTEWSLPNGTFPRSFSLSDTKLLSLRYAFAPSFYTPIEAGAVATQSIRGNNPPNTYVHPAQSGTTSQYRLDPAHANRMLLTSHSYSLDRPSLMPNLGDAQPNPYAGLGAIDLNRQLADYRENTALALGAPSNVLPTSQKYINAEQDRQRFAMDIFARLIVTTGAAAGLTINGGNVVLPPDLATENPTAFASLRNVAQLAANIVDYIDSDDICTRFNWNLNTATDVVFGVEKPRLVLNEIYSEIVNDPADGETAANGPNGPANVRFWVELLNPTKPIDLAAPGSINPIGHGEATLSHYRLEIGQATLAAFLNDPSNVTGRFNATPSIQFQLPAGVVVQPNWNTSNQAPYDPAGTPGQEGLVLLGPPVATPKTDEFNPGNADQWAQKIDRGEMVYTMGTTPPADVATVRNVRHVVLLRRLANPYLPYEENSNPFVTVDYMDNVPSFDSVHRLQNQRDSRGARPPATPGNGYDPMVERFAVGKVQPFTSRSVFTPGADTYPAYQFPNSMVLRQNPTMPVAGQPKHTFGRHNGQTSDTNGPAGPTFNATTNALNAATETLMTNFDWLVHLDRPLINQLELLHVSVGKPHEVTQQFISPVGSEPVVKHFNSAFIRMTRNDPLYLSLYRTLDLLRIQPYGQQTALSGRIPGRININTITDKRVWDALFDAQYNGFDQTFVDLMWTELVKSRSLNAPTVSTTANGTSYQSSIPGPTVYDTGSATGGRPFLPFGVGTVPVNGYHIGGTTPAATVFGGGVSINDTLLRQNPTVTTSFVPQLSVPSGMAHPYLQNEAARKIMNNVTTVSHTFAVWVTVGYFEVVEETPSGYPSSANVPNIVKLGKEYYKDVPGDFRYKFFAIVDRSTVGFDPASYMRHVTPGLGGQPLPFSPTSVSGNRPFFTTLEPYSDTQPTTPAGAPTSPTWLRFAAASGGPGFAVVYSDGEPVSIQGGAILVVGDGANRDYLNVVSVSYDATNRVATVNFSNLNPNITGLAYSHSPGEVVSNIVPGNPGPQPSFDPALPVNKPIVPHFSRIP